jgi:hypothetical protein
MKNQSILWPLAAIYTFLLYHQGAGMNILLLNLVLLTTLYIKYKNQLLQKTNLILVIGALFSAIFVSIHGHFLSVFANIVSLAFLSINLFLKKSSMLSLLLHSLYAYITTLVNRAIQRFNATPIQENETEQEKPKVNRLFIGLISVAVFGLFITFYRYSSASFNQFVLNLNLDFISFPLMVYYAFACGIVSIFLKPIYLENIANKELSQTNFLSHSTFKEYNIFGSAIQEITEDTLAKFLLIGLNLMLLLVNVLDTDFMLSGKLPNGVNYSEYLHQGVTSLILSILSAIAIILWFFRGSQNFKENKSIKYLTYLWIVLNIWLLASAAYRNQLYIADHSLYTYKRIGVYVFLLCALIGLGLTFFKIKNQYSNYFLIKSNSLVWYTILILSVSINWDGFIAKNHIQAAKQRSESPDLNYLCGLNYQAYPAVIDYLCLEMKKEGSQVDYDPYYYYANTEDLLQKMIIREQDYTWKSFNYARCKSYRQIHESLKGINHQLANKKHQRAFAIFNEFRNPLNF